MKKKILILCPWYAPYRTPLLRELAGEFDITVLYTMPREAGREWPVPENLPFKTVFLKPVFLWKTDVRKMFGERLLIRYPAGLVRMLMKTRPDVIVALEFRLDCMIGCLWSILRGCGYVTWSDMTPYHDMRLDPLRILSRRLLLSRSHALIGSCTDTLRHFAENFGYPKEKAFLSILSAHAHELAVSAGIPEKPAGKDDGQIRFLYVGELIPRKGVDLLIRAFAKVHTNMPGSLLTLVGKGVDKNALEKLAQDLGCGNAVIFRGSIPYEQVPAEMIQHDVFVLPTRLDVFGLVVAEAMSCGLPVICSLYAGAADDLVKDNGFIVDPEDAAGFASAMEKLAREPQLRTRMAEAGKTLLEKNGLASAVKGYADALHLAIRTAKKTSS